MKDETYKTGENCSVDGNRNTELCDEPHGQVSAYLDGELEHEASVLFEEHVRTCSSCAATLVEQKRLLAVLDTALFSTQFNGKEAMQLPKNFAQIVSVRAQTHISGLRTRREQSRALLLCVGLALVCGFILFAGTVALMGSARTVDAVRVSARAGESLIGVVGRAGRDASAGGAVVLRAIGGRFVSKFDIVAFTVWLAFAGSLIALLRLIGSYRREHTAE